MHRARAHRAARTPLDPAPLALAAAPLGCAAALALLRRYAARLPLAHPNDRTLHEAPVPRVGGIAIWAGWLPAALLSPPEVSGRWGWWLAAWLLVLVVSARDDWAAVPVAIRLACHALAAGIVAFSLADADLITRSLPAAFALGAIAIMWSANLFNFMDGSDGLAGTMTLVGFAALAVGAAHAGEPWTAHAALALATLPFLVVNRPPAKMFMGDVGSVPAGFLAGAFALDGWARGAWPAWFPLTVFLPFVLDASVTLVRRLARGERVWQAHRSHYYQRLNQLGFGHGGTLAVYAALTAAEAVAAVGCLLRAPDYGLYVLALFCAVHALLFATIDYHWRKQTETR